MVSGQWSVVSGQFCSRPPARPFGLPTVGYLALLGSAFCFPHFSFPRCSRPPARPFGQPTVGYLPPLGSGFSSRIAVFPNVTSSSNPTEIRICPSRGWWCLNLAEIWRYRDLTILLVRRDFVARYAQSVLGPAWFILQPLLTTLVFTIVFGQIAQIPTAGVPPVLFYLCNQLGWLYFSASFSAVSGTFTANQHLFSKVYFPRLVVPLASLAGNLIPLVIQVFSFSGFWIWFYLSAETPTFQLTGWLALAPLAFVQLALLALGFGLWMSALTAKYRDLAQLSGILIQLWMYASPVIMPLSSVPEKWRWLLEVNPVTMPIELLRLGLLGEGTVSAYAAMLSVSITLAVVLSGIALFSKVEKTFVDTV